MAVGEDVEARGLGECERDAGVGVADVDVRFGRGREAELDVAIAVVDFYFAGGIFDGYGIAVGAESDVSRGVDDFEIAGAGFHVAGERSEREIGALRDEAEAFGDFVGADGAVEFAVESEAAGGGGDVDLAVPLPEILMSPLVSETLTSPLCISMLTSLAVSRTSTSPLALVMETGVAMSETVMSPFSFRTVTEAFFGTWISMSMVMRESPAPTPVG